MKNIFKLVFALLLALPFYACEKFLDLQPLDNSVAVSNTASDSAVYKSGSEVEEALAGAYGDFKNEYFQFDYFVNGDAQSDNAYAGADNSANFQIDNYNIDATNGNVKRDWGYLYAAIGKVNKIINNVDSVSDPLFTAQRRMEIKGEASFIRAFMYFQLVQLWGDVPLQLTEIKTISAELLDEIYPIMFPARDPMDAVYSTIVSDLERALGSVKTTDVHKGYATKGAANAMLAKVYAAREPHEWDKVLKYCNDVIAGPYSLLPEFDQLWDNSAENTAESIFEINYSGGSSDGNWGAKMFRGVDWKKFNIPSNDLVKAFEEEQDNIRMEASVIYEDVSGIWTDGHWPQTHYPFLNKYRNFQEGSDQNDIFIRLADILLLKAEALNETGDVTGAAELVNQIRTRVDLPNTTAATKEAMRLAIEKERRLELAFEGHRWFDLKRTGRAIEVMNSATGVGGELLGYTLNQNRLLWPVPQEELDINTKLVQNPGY